MGVVALGIHPGLIHSTLFGDYQSAFTALAAVMGAAIGYALEMRLVRFSAKGVWWKRALRFALGFAVLMGLRLGVGALFDGLEPEWVFRLIRYTLIGFWIGFGAPWVFVKIRLAEQSETRTEKLR